MRSVRNASFARLAHPCQAGSQPQRKWQFLVPFLGALLGGLVSLGGIWLQHSLSNTAELKRAEREALLDTLTFKQYDNKPDFIVQSQMAWTIIRHTTYSNAETLKEQAAYLRQNKFCENDLSEDCKRALVETVAFNRRQLGLDPISPDDLRVLLDRPMKQLETALNSARKFGVTLEGDPAQH
jgi:hypothetical protein